MLVLMGNRRLNIVRCGDIFNWNIKCGFWNGFVLLVSFLHIYKADWGRWPFVKPLTWRYHFSIRKHTYTISTILFCGFRTFIQQNLSIKMDSFGCVHIFGEEKSIQNISKSQLDFFCQVGEKRQWRSILETINAIKIVRILLYCCRYRYTHTRTSLAFSYRLSLKQIGSGECIPCRTLTVSRPKENKYNTQWGGRYREKKSYVRMHV